MHLFTALFAAIGVVCSCRLYFSNYKNVCNSSICFLPHRHIGNIVPSQKFNVGELGGMKEFMNVHNQTGAMVKVKITLVEPE